MKRRVFIKKSGMAAGASGLVLSNLTSTPGYASQTTVCESSCTIEGSWTASIVFYKVANQNRVYAKYWINPNDVDIQAQACQEEELGKKCQFKISLIDNFSSSSGEVEWHSNVKSAGADCPPIPVGQKLGFGVQTTDTLPGEGSVATYEARVTAGDVYVKFECLDNWVDPPAE